MSRKLTRGNPGIGDATKLTDSWSYDAFGNSRARSGSNPQPFQ